MSGSDGSRSRAAHRDRRRGRHVPPPRPDRERFGLGRVGRDGPPL